VGRRANAFDLTLEGEAWLVFAQPEQCELEAG